MQMTKNKLKYPPEFKKEVCEYIKNEPIASASLVFNVSRNTITRWKNIYGKAGIEGFIIKRKSTAAVKLDKKTIQKIINYKADNPRCTLKDIKTVFKLDCDISLISRKVNKVRIKQKNKGNDDQIFLELNTVSQIIFRNEINSVYQLAIYSNDGRLLSLGFTKSRNSRNICLFIRYSLDSVTKKRKYRYVSEILTRLNYISDTDFDLIIRDRYNIKLKIDKTEKFNKLIITASRNIKDSIIESYYTAFNKMDPDELKDSMMAPRVNIDKLNSQVMSDIEWNTVPLPVENAKTRLEVLKDIKATGDKVLRESDYKKAEKIYTKVYAALSEIKISDKELMFEMLLKKANNEKDPAVWLMLLQDCLKFTVKHKLLKEKGETYYHIAQNYRFHGKMKTAIKYMDRSLEIFKECSSDRCKCLYYRSLGERSYFVGDYKKVLDSNLKYYKYAKIINNEILISRSLGKIGESYTYLSEIDKSEKAFLKAKKYNIEKGFWGAACFNNYFLLVFNNFKGNDKAINILFDELKDFSDKAKELTYYYAAHLQVGGYYYNRGDYIKAEEYFFTALYKAKNFIQVPIVLQNKPYYFYTLYKNGKFNKAVRNLHKFIKLNKNIEDQELIISAFKFLALIYYEENNYEKSVFYFNKTLKNSIRYNEPYYTAFSYRFLAKIAFKRNDHHKAEAFCHESLKYYYQCTVHTQKENVSMEIPRDINEVKQLLNDIDAIK